MEFALVWGEWYADRLIRADRSYSDTHQITSAGLGTVERAVRAVEQICRRLDLGLGEIGYADAHGEAERIALPDVELVRLDLVAESLRKRNRAGLARLGNGDHELVAAVAGDGIDAARGPSEEEGDFDEHLVAREMPERVVHILELVDVDHQDAEWRVVAARPLHFRAELREQGPAIEQLRERIGAGQRLEPEIVGLRDLHHVRATHGVHGALDHGLREVDVSCVKRSLLGRAAEQEHAGPIEIEPEGQRDDRTHRDDAAVFLPRLAQRLVGVGMPDVGDQNRLVARKRRFDLRILVELDLEILELRIFVRRGDGSQTVAGLRENDG